MEAENSTDVHADFGTRRLDNDLKHGIVREVYPSGLIEEGLYKDGQRHGYTRTIREDGTYHTGFYQDGKAVGTWKSFDALFNPKDTQSFGP